MVVMIPLDLLLNSDCAPVLSSLGGTVVSYDFQPDCLANCLTVCLKSERFEFRFAVFNSVNQSPGLLIMMPPSAKTLVAVM